MADQNLGVGVERFRVYLRRLKNSTLFLVGAGFMLWFALGAGGLLMVADYVEFRAFVSSVLASLVDSGTTINLVLDEDVTQQT